MNNPYEAPQTTDTPLPMAKEVTNVPPEHGLLSIAIAHCAQAGRLYLIGTGIAWLLILLGIFRIGADSNPRDNVWLIIPSMFLVVTSFVFFGWGLLQALVGYFQLRAKSHEPRVSRIYTLIVLEFWLKALLLIVLLFLPERQFTWWRIWDWFRLIPYVGLIISYLHTYYLHYLGILLLSERSESPSPRVAAAGFLVTGILLALGSILTATYLRQPYGELWIITAGLLAALHIAGYAAAYKKVHRGFQSRNDSN